MTRSPEDYHFTGRDPFYEGWYARVTDPKTGETFSLIYGISNPGGTGPDPVGYLIAFNGAESARIYQRFPLEEVDIGVTGLDVGIGPGRYESTRVSGETQDDSGSCRWSLSYEPSCPWRTSFFNSPMTYAMHLPGIETSWHVFQLEARVTGSISWRGTTFTFDRAPGYTEKIWGRIFPEDWFWLQANTFDQPGAALCGSGGIVPLPVISARVRMGMIGYFDGTQLHAFASHHGDQIRAETSAGRWQIDARSLTRRLEIDARCDQDSLVALEGPTATGVRPVALETLIAKAEVRLSSRAHPFAKWRLRQIATTSRAGAEVGGPRWFDSA